MLSVVFAVCGVLGAAAAAEEGAAARGAFSFERAPRRRDGGADDTRRVFGGRAAPLSAFGATCALLDRYLVPRCSGAVLAARWTLTAAHCVAPHVAYVQYNMRRPSPAEGETVPVVGLYRHPEYRVEHSAGQRDVTLLQHDVGLVLSARAMRLATSPPRDPIEGARHRATRDLVGEVVQVSVFGFGSTERSSRGEELFEVRLRVAECGRERWRRCVCGVPAEGDGASRGVCSGDSGGPVVWRDLQVAVTSLGPLECAPGGRYDAVSVFTELRDYADVINATVSDAEGALHMRRLEDAATCVAPSAPPAALALGALLLAHVS